MSDDDDDIDHGENDVNNKDDYGIDDGDDNRFEPKTMFSIFFKSNSIVNLTYLESGKTIDNNSYLIDCLKPLVHYLLY
jgi:hypothetical protein